MPKVQYTRTKGLVQRTGAGVTGLLRREVISVTTANKSLSVDESGALVLLAGSGAARAVQLPTITANDVGVYYDFVVETTGNGGAAGAHTISTGGHATDATGASATAGYDDFSPNGRLLVIENTLVMTAAGDAIAVKPAASEGTMVLAENTVNALCVVGSKFRATAIIASVIGTANTDVWLLEGALETSQATGFVTTNLFTA